MKSIYPPVSPQQDFGKENNLGFVHTTPDTSENEVFKLKMHQMFSMRITHGSETSRSRVILGLFQENSGREIT